MLNSTNNFTKGVSNKRVRGSGTGGFSCVVNRVATNNCIKSLRPKGITGILNSANVLSNLIGISSALTSLTRSFMPAVEGDSAAYVPYNNTIHTSTTSAGRMRQNVTKKCTKRGRNNRV